MKFRYRGRDSAGVLQSGAVEAADQRSALIHLQQGGLVVTDLHPARGIDLKMEIDLSLSARKVTTEDLALYCDQLSTLLGAGVPVLQALRVLADQFKGKKLGSIVTQVITAIEGGGSLSLAIREHGEHLPPTMVYLTAVAEVSGRLDEAYGLLARQFEAEAQLARKIRTATTYPVAVLVVAALVVTFMLVFVLPSYGNLFAEMGATMPALSRVLMNVGGWIRSFWYLLPPLLLALWLGGRQVLRVPRVRAGVDGLLHRVPLIGALREKRELSRFTRTLGMMHRSGVPLMAALSTIGAAAPEGTLKRAVADIQHRVADGETFGDALRVQKLFDRISVEMIALGEQAGTMETMLFKVADVAEKDVNLLLERLTSLIEPMMTLLIGGVVVAIIVPMILPMFDILGQVK